MEPTVLTSTPPPAAPPQQFHTPPKILVDSVSTRFQIVEGTEGPTGRVRVRGEFARCGIATENKRVYPKQLWEREIGRLDSNFSRRQVYGHLDHPASGRTELALASHIITKMEIAEDGRVIGEAEILDTDRGRNLKALLQANCMVGVSSRGYGSTKQNMKGEDVVQDDYRLVTFDFVAEPADTNAYPQVFFEGTEIMATVTPTTPVETAPAATPEVQKPVVESQKPVDDARVQKLVEDAKLAERENLKNEFAKEMVATLGKLKSELREQIRTEFLSDPSVAQAKAAIEQLRPVLRPFLVGEDTEAVLKQADAEKATLRNKISERDLQVESLKVDHAKQLETLKSENTKLAHVAREAGYKYYKEQLVSADPDAALIRKLVGDVKSYESSTSIKSKVESIKAEMTREREARMKIEEQVAADKAAQEKSKRELAERAHAENSDLRGRVEQLESALSKAAEANKILVAQNYAERRLTGNPNSVKIRSMIESAQANSKDKIDSIIESFQSPTPTAEDVDAARSRVRRLTKSTVASTPLEEEAPSADRQSHVPNYNGTGLDLQDLLKRSGIIPAPKK